MIRREELRLDDKLRALDPDTKHRDVVVIELHDDKMRVQRVGNGRRNYVRLPTEHYERVNG